MNAANDTILFNNECLKTILTVLGTQKPEHGGIIGKAKRTNKIAFFAYDEGVRFSNRFYIPNVEMLNGIIEKWDRKGIEFEGIVHSHELGNHKLSKADITYAIKTLGFFPQKELILMVLVDTDAEKYNISAFNVSKQRVRKLKIIKGE